MTGDCREKSGFYLQVCPMEEPDNVDLRERMKAVQADLKSLGIDVSLPWWEQMEALLKLYDWERKS